MNREHRQLIAKITSTAKDGKGRRRFSPDLRREVIAYARTQLSAGQTQQSIGDSLGLSARMLWKWLRGSTSPVREVSITAVPAIATARTGPRIVLRGGIEIVDLDIDAVIAIAKALS